MAKSKSKAKRSPFTIKGVEIVPGTTATIDLPIADLYTHTTLTMPMRIIHGKRDGPVMFVNAALHGDEINGVEIIRRLCQAPALKNLRGTLLIIPVVNVFGFTDHDRYLPDRRDLNRSFPGSEKGSLASRLAYIFMEEVVKRSDVGIDLHTGSNYRANLPQIRACLDDAEVARLSDIFGAPVILDAPLREGSLREAAGNCQTRVLVYETGEPLSFNELGIRMGVKGIQSVMRAIGMLPARRPGKRKVTRHIAGSSVWVRAPQSGILNARAGLGDQVQAGDKLGDVSDTFGDHGIDVVSTVSGIVIGCVTMPLVNEGAALFHIARFENPDDVSASVDAFREEMLDPNEIEEAQISM